MTFKVISLGFLAALMVGPAFASTSAPPKPQTQVPAGTQAPAQPSTGKATPTPTLKGEPPAQTAPAHGATPAKKTAPAKPEKKVDINNASLAELKTLPTVGDNEAKKIIANRPYKSKGELVTKAGLPEGVYQAVRHKIEMQKPRKPAPKK